MSPQDLVITHWGARFRGRHLPCAIGRAGIAQKIGEGDNITPVGTWRINKMYFRPDRTLMHNADPIQLHDAWCDDPNNTNYNQLIKTNGPSTETLRRADPLYDLIAVLDHNRDPIIPGAGSSIFLHVWRKPRHPTAGCIAFSFRNLYYILSNWRDGKVIIRA